MTSRIYGLSSSIHCLRDNEESFKVSFETIQDFLAIRFVLGSFWKLLRPGQKVLDAKTYIDNHLSQLMQEASNRLKEKTDLEDPSSRTFFESLVSETDNFSLIKDNILALLVAGV